MTATVQTFADRAALITGAARGIGFAIARKLAEGGAAVVIADVLEVEGERAAAKLRDQGFAARFTPLDVTDEAAWERVVAEIVGTEGGLDIVVNNAGIEITTLISDFDPEAFRRLLDVNLVGVGLGLKHALRAMRPGGAAGKGGAVVNLSSMAAQLSTPATGPYAAAKAGVERLTKVAAAEAGKLQTGVRVNCLLPGFVPTALSTQSTMTALQLGLFDSPDQLQAMLDEAIPLKRLGTAEEIAEAAAFLCSDAAGYITGAALPVAGGLGS